MDQIVETTQQPKKRKFTANRSKGKNIDPIVISEQKPEQGFDVLLDKFLRHCGNRGLKPRTVKTYKDNTKRLIKWLENERKITEPGQVTGDDLEDYIYYIINDRHDSKSYVNIIIRNTKPYFKWLTEKGHINKCPYDGIKLLRVDQKKKESIPKENFKRLLSIPTRDYFGDRDTMILEVLYGCGVRIGECLNLKIKDVDFENDRLILEDTKNREDSFVPLPANMIKPLRTYIRKHLLNDNVGEYLFQNQNGGNLSYRSFVANLESYCKQAGIPRITCHQFRHSFSINYLMDGGDVASLQRILRHKDPKMVNIYLNWVPEAITKKMLAHNPFDKLYDGEDEH